MEPAPIVVPLDELEQVCGAGGVAPVEPVTPSLPKGRDRERDVFARILAQQKEAR